MHNLRQGLTDTITYKSWLRTFFLEFILLLDIAHTKKGFFVSLFVRVYILFFCEDIPWRLLLSTTNGRVDSGMREKSFFLIASPCDIPSLNITKHVYVPFLKWELYNNVMMIIKALIFLQRRLWESTFIEKMGNHSNISFYT